MKSPSRLVRFVTLAAFLAGSNSTFALTGTWKQTVAGTYNWDDAINWTGSVPGFSPLFNDIANLNNNIAGAQTITIATSLDLDILQIGDTQGTLFGFTLNPVAGQTITFRDTDVSAAQLNKVGTVTDTINAKIITLDALEIDVAVVNNVAGTLVLGGGLSILGNSDQPGVEVARKDSGGILQVTGNLEVGEMGGLLMSAGTMNATGSYNTFRGGVEVTGGTLNVAGSTNVFDPLTGPAIQMTGGNINLGSTTISSRNFIGGPISQTVGGNLNIGVDGAISSNYLYAGAITKSAGTLRFQASEEAGSSTTLLGGARTTAVAPSLVSGNTSVSFESVNGLAAGMRVYGPGVPNGTLIQSVDAGTNTVVLSQAPTADFTDVSLMFAQGVQGVAVNSTIGNAELTGLASTAGLAAGMTVRGPNIPEGARILSVGLNSLTLDVPATGSGAITVNTFAVSSLNLDGGATQLWEPVRPTSTVGPTLGSVNVDPSIRLQLNGSATFNFSDLGTTASATATTLINSPVVTVPNTTGMKVGDSVRGTNIPNYARIVSINGNQVTLSVNAIASAAITNFGVYENTTFSSLNSSSSTSQILATLLGGEGLSTQGTLTVGNFSAVGDVFNGVLNFTDSGANVRLIKVGSNTLTLGGTGNNPTARVQVLEGTVVLNKASAPGVSAIGSGGILLIGDSDSSVETASLGGTFTGSAFNMATWPGASAVINYTDQLNFNSSVELSGNGVFNLNGFSEGFNVLSGTGSVLNNGSGEVSLILGQNNSNSTFSGTIVNGTGGMALVKSGTGTLTLDGLNTFTGSTLIGGGNVILGQANGALANTDTLRISGGAGLQLNSTTASTTSSNRINDSASVYLSQGTITIRNDSNVNNNVDEATGAMTVDEGSSFLRANHATNVGNRVSLSMSTLERVAGGTVAFGQVSTLANRGLGTGITPFNSATQFTVGTVPSSLLIGGSGTAGTPAVNVLLGAFGGDLNSSTNEFMTIQTALGKNYIRPLSDVLATREYATILSGNVTSNVGKVESNTSFAANTAANGIRFSGRSTHTLSDNVMLKLGGNSDINFSPTTTVGSGMLIFSSSVAGASTRIQGGYVDAGSREFIVRANASGLIQSSIDGSAGLVKDGDGQLSLYGQNEYAGITYVTGGTLRVMNAQGLGASGVGNSLKVALGRTIEVGNSSIIGSNGGKDLELLGGASYSGLNGHSVLIGNTTVNAADETGKNRNAFLRVGGSFGSLTVDGNITGGGNSVDPIYSGASGRGLWFDGAGSREAIINVLGTITDQNSAPVAGGSHERLNLFVRGSSSATEAFNEFHVNLANASQVHGQLSIRSGFVRLAGGYGTASTTDTPANRLQILLRDTGTDSPNQLGVLSMTTPGSIYNTRDISWADNNGGYSATSYGMRENCHWGWFWKSGHHSGRRCGGIPVFHGDGDSSRRQ
jgi:fibronectin-binding autotransporter adhesin